MKASKLASSSAAILTAELVRLPRKYARQLRSEAVNWKPECGLGATYQRIADALESGSAYTFNKVYTELYFENAVYAVSSDLGIPNKVYVAVEAARQKERAY